MKQPNILHLFTDMQRWDTIHALGNPVIKTPNLDRLVREGVAFTNAFSPSPVCIAARAAMIFGQYPYNTGCYENTVMPTDGRSSFMQGLVDAGYTAHGIGKCHFTPERYALRGFSSREVQEEGGVKAGQLEQNPYVKHLKDSGYDHILEPYGVRGEMYYTPQISQVPAKDHHTQWVGDRARAFISGESQYAPGAARTGRGSDNAGAAGDKGPGAAGTAAAGPWYLYTSFIHPHPPFNPPTPWHKLYRPATMPLPNVPQDHESLLTLVNRVQNRYKYQDQGTNLHLVRAIIAYYYACISFVDFQIGKILETLEETGQLDNTLILFSSDHGEFLGDYRCYGKRTMHDPSSRVPMICRFPDRFEAGKVVDQAVSLVDIAPTFLSAADASVESHRLDGVDLAEVAAGTCDREYVFSQLSIDRTAFHRSITKDTDASGREWSDDEWRARYSSYMAVSREAKYVYSAPDDREFFFNRVADPRENRNRFGVRFEQEKRDAAKRALLEELVANGETTGIAGAAGDGQSLDWRRFPKIEVDPDPDSGLLVQDMYTPWFDTTIPGYSD